MKERTVVMTFEVVTDLPAKVLREATVAAEVTEHGWVHVEYIKPVNKPRVEVIQPVKKRKKDR